MAYPSSVSSGSSLGAKAQFIARLISYYLGSPGNVSLPVGWGCPESKAIEAKGAVALVVADKACEKVQGIRIIIGDTAESIHSGFELVNMNFHTSGTQVSVANNLNLSAPIMA